MDDNDGLEDIEALSMLILRTGVACCSLALISSCSCRLLALSLLALYPLPRLRAFTVGIKVGMECDCCGDGRRADEMTREGGGGGFA